MSVNEEIIKALEHLGYKAPNPVVTYHSPNRWTVELNGKYIGIWDGLRKTFVD